MKRDHPGHRFFLVARALAVVLPCLFCQSLIAQAPQGVGYEPYQAAFAKALKKIGAKQPPPQGPRWLKPQVRPAKEGCLSCHLGVQDKRFLFARNPYKFHGGHALADHPLERFGCVICHGGFPAGLTFQAAGHAPPPDPGVRQRWKKQLGWTPPGKGGMVPLPYIAGRCIICHAPRKLPDGAGPYQAARDLVAQKRCSTCHGFQDEPEKKTPRAHLLKNLGSELGGSWLASYLKNPAAERAPSAMPAYAYQPGEALALAAFLLAGRDPALPWKQEDPAQDAAAVKRGLAAVQKRRCWTCHDIPGIEDQGFIKQEKIGPPLAHVGESTNPAWFRKWLQDPHAIRPEAGMPHFRLQPEEIADLSAFLASLRRAGQGPPAPAAAAKGSARKAALVAATYRCASCHTFAGLDLTPPEKSDLRNVGAAIFARLQASALDPDHLEGPEGIFHRGPAAPRLFAPGESTAPLLTFLAGEASLQIPPAFKLPAPTTDPPFQPQGPAGQLITELRCLSCHTMRGTGGNIGPLLTYAGSKLKHSWIVKFLPAPTLIRPMNRARMPLLGITKPEAELLADWIKANLKAPRVEQDQPDLEDAFDFEGEAKVKSPYGCVTCHKIAKEGGQVGPELTHVASRLTTSWIHHWIQDPKHWIPKVRMPNFNLSKDDLNAITLFLSEQK